MNGYNVSINGLGSVHNAESPENAIRQAFRKRDERFGEHSKLTINKQTDREYEVISENESGKQSLSVFVTKKKLGKY